MAVKVRVAGVREGRVGMTRVDISPSSGLDSANPLPYGDAALPLNGSLCCTLTSLSDAVLLSGFTFGACLSGAAARHSLPNCFHVALCLCFLRRNLRFSSSVRPEGMLSVFLCLI